MKIEDWFDIHNKEHLAAWKHLNTKGSWPVGFVPYDDVELEQNWQINIMSIMANAWIEHDECDVNFIEWKRKTEQYGNGVNAYCGNIKVGEVFWDSCTSDRSLRYKVNCTLPQVKRVEANFATEQEGKDKLQSLVTAWFNALERDK